MNKYSSLRKHQRTLRIIQTNESDLILIQNKSRHQIFKKYI
jgi:hypothetical protein